MQRDRVGQSLQGLYRHAVPFWIICRGILMRRLDHLNQPDNRFFPWGMAKEAAISDLHLAYEISGQIIAHAILGFARHTLGSLVLPSGLRFKKPKRHAYSCF